MKFRFKLNEELSNEYDSEGNLLSPEQIEFFKNSKVRDSKGRLLVCYHGTDKEFDVFAKDLIGTNTHNSGFFGKGFYFTNDKDTAEFYSNFNKRTPQTKSLYLNITNPFMWNDYRTKQDFSKVKKMLGLSTEIEFSNGYAPYAINQFINGGNADKFSSALAKNGFDGIIFSYDGEVFEIIAFEPNQIKSITNKTPTNSSNINEDLIFEDKYVDIIADYDEINKYLHYNYEWADTPDEENYSQLIDKEGRFIHCPPSKSSFTHKLLLDDLIESGLVSMGDAYNYLNTSLFGNLGYVRCNDYDGYVQLPKDITYDQIDAISKWIDEYFLGRGYTVIDTSCEENKTYSRYMFEYDDRHQADDYIKMLKRFKNSGKLMESLKHINEDLMRKEGMYVFHSPYSLMDFLQTQTKDIRILYDANLDLYFACDGDKYIHRDMVEQAFKEGYYYGIFDGRWDIDGYLDDGRWGYINDDGEEIGAYVYHIIFSPDNSFKIGMDGYEEEYNTSMGRFLTRDCELEEIDLYKVVKRYM